jgi:hypothetical protein
VVSTIYSPPELAGASDEPYAIARAWLRDNWQMVAGALVALGALGILWRAFRGGARPPEVAATESGRLFLVTDEGNQPARAPAARPRAPLPEALREELADVVRHDPQAALGVLRSWIGNAS